MLISSISMKNFECYTGEHSENTLEFSEGLNLIIGNNGHGKSKIFNAFYWLLYDQVFLSKEKAFLPTNVYKESLISDKAKTACSVGDSLAAEVMLLVRDARNVEYRLTRIYRAKKLDDRQWQCEDFSKLLVDERKVNQWVSLPKQKHQGILDRVIAPHLKPYMWFQGEQVDGLMDFTDKGALNYVIDLLSDIKNYDELLKLSVTGFERADKEYRKALSVGAKNQAEAGRLNTELEGLKKKVSAAELSLENDRENLNMAKIKIEEMIGQIADAEKKAKHSSRASEIEKETSKLVDALERKQNGFYKKMFSNYWVLKHAESSFEKFSNRYSVYCSQHLKAATPQGNVEPDLPLNVPQPIHVNRMLEDEKCFVCGRDAKKGSEPHKHMESLVNRTPEAEKSVFLNDSSALFQKLYDNGLGFKRTIASIDADIAEELSDTQGLSASITGNRKELESIRVEFDYLLADDNPENVVSAYRSHERNRDNYTSLVSSGERSLEKLQEDEEKCRRRLESLAEGVIDQSLEDAKNVFEQLKEVCKLTRDEVYSSLIDTLETTANEIFASMTARNTAITGNIELRKLSNGCYMPEIVDGEGHIIRGLNDANLVLVKLALIMSTISSRSSWVSNYTLISDAPTSKMALNYTMGFYEELSKQFKQSIIMTFDFLDPADRDCFDNFNMGKVYTLDANYPDGDKNDRSDLNVTISEVQL